MFWIKILGVYSRLIFKLFHFKLMEYPKVKQEFEPYQEHFSAEDRKRVLYYYPFFIGIACSDMLAWQGYKMTPKDKMILRLTCILVPLYDSFFDDDHYDLEQLEKMTFSENYEAKTEKERAFRELHAKQKSLFAQGKDFETPLRKVLEAQWESKLQKQKKELNSEHLMTITTDKSFTSVHLIFDYLEGFPADTYKELFTIWGRLIQLANDIFDVYRDRLQGVQTLASNLEPEYLAEVYTENLKHFKQEIEKLDSSSKAKLFYMRQAFLTNALVALEQYADLKKKYQADVWKNLHPTLERKELITDMELWSNRFKWLGYMRKCNWKNIEHYGRHTD